jgi:hypothetical protein
MKPFEYGADYKYGCPDALSYEVHYAAFVFLWLPSRCLTMRRKIIIGKLLDSLTLSSIGLLSITQKVKHMGERFLPCVFYKINYQSNAKQNRNDCQALLCIEGGTIATFFYL